MSRATRVLEPRTRWPLVARLRTAHPVYSGLLPQGELGYRVLPLGGAVAYAALMCLAAMAVRRLGGAVIVVVLLFTAMAALGVMDPKEGARKEIENITKHYAGIHADPPDPAFRQPSPLTAEVFSTVSLSN